MPARGARTTSAASRTAAILQPRNAGPPCAALAMDFAPRTPIRGRPMGRAEAGMRPARRGAIAAAIREPDPAYCDRNCGGRGVENPERTVAQPLSEKSPSNIRLVRQSAGTARHRTALRRMTLLGPRRRQAFKLLEQRRETSRQWFFRGSVFGLKHFSDGQQQEPLGGDACDLGGHKPLPSS
jgi:hypothetical protein